MKPKTIINITYTLLMIFVISSTIWAKDYLEINSFVEQIAAATTFSLVLTLILTTIYGMFFTSFGR